MCPEPDPISNSAVKHTSAHGTVSQDTGESVAARPAQHKTHTHSLTQHDPGRRSRDRHTTNTGAGWSSPVARQAHNLKVAGSNPAPATKHSKTRTEPAAARTAHTPARTAHAARASTRPGPAAPHKARAKRIRTRAMPRPPDRARQNTPRERGGGSPPAHACAATPMPEAPRPGSRRLRRARQRHPCRSADGSGR